MAFKDLREFIAFLEEKGELRRVGAEVDPCLEIGEVADRASKAHGPGLLFEHPKGSDIPVAINLMGSYDRMAWALGAEGGSDCWSDLDTIAAKVMDLVPLDLPASMKGKLDALMGLKELAGLGPTEVKAAKAPVQEVVLEGDEVDLGTLPVLTTWPGDGGPFITLPTVVTTGPEGGRHNLGMYRLQVFDRDTTGMHIHVHHDGAANMRAWAEAGHDRMPVAAALGGDPATIFSATAPVPPIVGEYLFSGILRGEPVEVVKCVTNELKVPARAEIVLEGYVEIGELRREGPFGDHTGYYSLADDYPVFHVEAITMRPDAIYPTTIVGRPPMEDCYMGKATERLFLPVIQAMMPEVVDYDLPLEGVFHNCAIFSIKKEYPGQAFRVMDFAWSMGQMMFTKFVIVVDDEVDPHDYSQVAWRCFNNVDPSRDVMISKGPLDVLDHSSPHERFGHKMGIDATKPLADEGHPREWPASLEMSPEVKARIDALWPELGID